MIEISGLRFIGKTEGQNNLRKLKAWLPSKVIKKLPDLRTRQFFRQYGSKIDLIETLPFKAQYRAQDFEKVLELQRKIYKVPEFVTVPRKKPKFY